MSKTMSTEVLSYWIKKNSEHLEVKGMIMLQEFIYLSCNCQDKLEMVFDI
jgi:hypothetical protein